MRALSITRVTMTVLMSLLLVSACSVAESKNSADLKQPASQSAANSSEPKGATIPIDPNGPADTVRVFYKLLREKKFREAIFLTNLRPAIEGLTDMEMKDFALDFEAIAGDVPAEIEINGEIITGDQATVTANLPTADGDKKDIQTIKLRRENGIWIIRSADDEAEKKIKQEGKNYFYALRIETHEQEARKMLDRIAKAELAHSLQNNGLYADMPTLVTAGLLPDDIKTSDSTGYNYTISVTGDKKRYSATATPATYGKSGKLSFLLQLDAKGIGHLTSKDIGGKVLNK